jgi:hypothetical protein
MKILFLSADNLRNTPFIKDLVFHFKGAGKCILLHDHFGSIADTRFVTKRISSLLSEEMITNNPFSGDQRSIFQESAGTVTVRADFLEQALQRVDVLVMNALGVKEDVTAPLDSLAITRALRAAFPQAQVHVFPRNTRSPLVASPRLLSHEADIEPLRAVYDEETPALEMAAQLLPVVMASPANFLQALA